MILITVTRLPGGYRLLAASSYQSQYYCWSLYRAGALLAVISHNYHGENSINFDLYEPLAPGQYNLRVECFAWQPPPAPPAFVYHTDMAALHLKPAARVVLELPPPQPTSYLPRGESHQSTGHWRDSPLWFCRRGLAARPYAEQWPVY